MQTLKVIFRIVNYTQMQPKWLWYSLRDHISTHTPKVENMFWFLIVQNFLGVIIVIFHMIEILYYEENIFLYKICADSDFVYCTQIAVHKRQKKLLS